MVSHGGLAISECSVASCMHLLAVGGVWGHIKTED